MINLNDYLTASGKYPERAKSKELTPELLKNAKNLLERVNALLNDLNINKAVVTSGFRPTTLNANIPGAATKSNHTKCLAIDLLDDKQQSLAQKFSADLLRKHELFMEDEKFTRGKNSNWVHVQYTPSMKDRLNRKFIP